MKAPDLEKIQTGKRGRPANLKKRVAALFAAQLALWSPERLAAARRELGGKNLACWCPLDGGPCHADALLRAANP